MSAKFPFTIHRLQLVPAIKESQLRATFDLNFVIDPEAEALGLQNEGKEGMGCVSFKRCAYFQGDNTNWISGPSFVKVLPNGETRQIKASWIGKSIQDQVLMAVEAQLNQTASYTLMDEDEVVAE